MEITNEIKAKVFAQYLGQKVTRGGIMSIDLLYACKNAAWDDYNSITLRLKPLTAITDEDAIECINILLGTKGSMYQDWEESIQKRWLVQIKHELRDNLGSTMRIAGFKSVYSLTQYLQSKGYDIPNYFLEGKTLIECGMAIEQEN